MNLQPFAEPLWLDVSLWSADLANLESEIRRLEPYADSFHLDAADGHYVRTLLFFPDLVARIRQITKKPLHVHLFATRPMDLLPLFLDAGADWVTLPLETGKRVWQAIEQAQARGRAPECRLSWRRRWRWCAGSAPACRTSSSWALRRA